MWAVTDLVNRYEGSSGREDRWKFFKKAFAELKDVIRTRSVRGLFSGAELDKKSIEESAREFLEAGDKFDLEQEVASEPSEYELFVDRLNELSSPLGSNRRLMTSKAKRSVPAVYWPANDVNSPDYAHMAGYEVIESSFNLTVDDLNAAFELNAFTIPTNVKKVVVAIRGAKMMSHEAVGQTSIPITEVRPNHSDFRCLIGVWDTSSSLLTLFSASTVPCPYYMKNYYFKQHGMPHYSSIDCNMLPSGHYVFRVGSHSGGSIKPALRMSEPDNLGSDARACVWRTSNDVTYGLADDLRRPARVYDNVHCSYFVSYMDSYESFYSSAGCLTVRGRKDPSHQWSKFQDILEEVGQGNRADLVLITGKELAIISAKRAGGTFDEEKGSLRRLRIGSFGDEVKLLQEKLGRSPTGYLDADTQYAFWSWQKQTGLSADGIYSPATESLSQWGILS